MNSNSRWLLLATVLVAFALYTGSGLQAQTPQVPLTPQTQAPLERLPDAPQVQQDKTFEGTLLKIDAAKNLLTMTGPDDKQWEFTYNDRTEVIGSERSVQGLAGKPGAKLKITYRMEQGTNLATRIEMPSDERDRERER